jgi:hypothetical protein
MTRPLESLVPCLPFVWGYRSATQSHTKDDKVIRSGKDDRGDSGDFSPF